MRPADGEHGLRGDVAPVARQFVELFKGYDVVVCPTGSCTVSRGHCCVAQVVAVVL